MATVSSSPQAGQALPSDPSSSKRLLLPPTNEEGEKRKIKKARMEEPPPSFADATLVPISSLSAQTSTKETLEKQYIRGEVLQVLKWKEETQTAKIFLKDATGILLELKGAWARTVQLPNVSSKLTVSLEGVVLEDKEGAPGQASVGAVFGGGVKMKWGKQSVDGFQLQRSLSDASSTKTTISGSSSLEDIEAIMVARSSSVPPPVGSISPSASIASDPSPQPALPPIVSSAASTTAVSFKRPHSPTPEAGSSSKKPTTTSNALLPPSSTSPSPSTTPSSKLPRATSNLSTASPSSSNGSSSKMKNLVLAKVRLADPNLDGDLLSRVVDAIMLSPMDVLKKCMFDVTALKEQMDMARVIMEFEEDGDADFSNDANGEREGEVEPPVVRLDEPPVEEEEAAGGGGGAEGSLLPTVPEVPEQQPSSPRVKPLPPPTSNDATSSRPSNPIPPPGASTSSAAAGPSRLPPQPASNASPTPSSNLPSASAASLISNRSLSISASCSSVSSTYTTSTNGTKLNKAQKKAQKKRLAAGGGGEGWAAAGPSGSGSGSSVEPAGAKRSRMAIERGDFELGLKTEKHTYFDIASLRGLPSGPTRRCTIGVVTNIQPLKISKNNQPFVNFRIDDPSGQISVKMFATDVINLPVEPKLQIGSVILLRDLKRADFQETPDFVGGSFDGFSWAFADTDLEKFEHQPLRGGSTMDLESLATLGPFVESYFRKLAAWSKKKFELVKDDGEVVRFANESVAIKSKGRRTLRLEEIVDEREFFDCIGQLVKVEFTDYAKDFWITDWTSNDFFENYGPSTSYDATPTEPFGTSCFKISAWNDLAEEITSSLRVGKVVRLRNVKPRVKNFWEGSMYDCDGCQIDRVGKTPELDALLDRRAVFITKLRADTIDNPLPDLASSVKVVARSNGAGRQTLPVEDIKEDTYVNLVCQIVSLQYLNTARSTVLEVTDFSENRLISPSSQAPPRSNPPVTRFGRFVLQLTLWDDEARGSTVQNLVSGDFVKIENVNGRLHNNGRLLAHVNQRTSRTIVPTVTVLHEDDASLTALLSRRHFFFNKKDDLADYRPPPPAPLVRPPSEELAPPRAGENRKIGHFAVGDVVDCLVQLVSVRPLAEGIRTLLITDYTSNPFISMVEPARAPTGSVYPTKPFGRCVLTVWVHDTLKLDQSFFDGLVEGKLLLIRGMQIKSSSKSLVGILESGEGVSVTRIPESDPRATSFLQLRYSYYNPSNGPLVVAPPPAASTSTIPRVSSPAPRPQPQPVAVASTSSDPVKSPPAVKLEPKEALIVHHSPAAGPSRLATPSRSPSSRASSVPFVGEDRGTSTASKEAMVALPRDTVSPTQTSFFDPDHPNGSSLLEISNSDRTEFMTRARIKNFLPDRLEDIVVSGCDVCDHCLDPDETRCTCPRASEEYITQTYRLLLVLQDGSKETHAVLCGEQLLELFPSLPPASQFADYLARSKAHLVSQFQILAPHLSTKISGRPPLLDLGLRKTVVRVDGVEKIYCTIFGTTFRDAT